MRAWLVALAVALAAPACRNAEPPVRPGPYADYCTRRAQCEGGNHRDINACQASVAGTIAQAEAFGCREVYTAMLQCLLRGARCAQRQYGANCAAQLAAANACIAAGAATGR